MNDKIIKIVRHFNLVEMQQDDPSVTAWLGESYRPIGSYFTSGKTVASGLSFDEQKYLMPPILGIEATDKDFRKEVEAFFHGILTNVPKGGLELRVGLTDDSKPLGPDNMPINVRDYVVWRHAQGHPHVGRDKAEAERYHSKRFYVIDPQKAQGEALKINKLEDQAAGLYFQYKDDDLKVDQILTMMGISIKGMKKDDKTLKLKDLTKVNPKMNEVEQQEYFKAFINTCEDPNLSIKFLIEELVGAQVIERVGTVHLLKEDGQRLGDTLEEAVLYVTNPKNTRLLNQLKAQYQLKVRKGVFDIPKVGEDKKKDAE